ncbi:MAG: hypothetical protein DRP42_07770, partial [Tenericutes bacterium]
KTKVTSIEMDHEEWFHKLNSKYGSWDKFSPLIMLGPNKAIDYLRNLDERFDLIFVDGYPGSRWRAVNEAFKKADVVVAHDMDFVELNNYHLITMPADWQCLTYTEVANWTSVWSQDTVFLGALAGAAQQRGFKIARNGRRQPRKGQRN